MIPPRKSNCHDLLFTYSIPYCSLKTSIIKYSNKNMWKSDYHLTLKAAGREQS